jgi:hypothetical protein
MRGHTEQYMGRGDRLAGRPLGIQPRVDRIEVSRTVERLNGRTGKYLEEFWLLLGGLRLSECC